MTTTTTERELPTDHGKLNAFLPAPPTDNTVAEIATAITRLDEAIAEVRADLDRLETIDRATVNALVDAAIHDDHLEVLVARLDPGHRAEVAHRLTQLQAARAAAATATPEPSRPIRRSSHGASSASRSGASGRWR